MTSRFLTGLIAAAGVLSFGAAASAQFQVQGQVSVGVQTPVIQQPPPPPPPPQGGVVYVQQPQPVYQQPVMYQQPPAPMMYQQPMYEDTGRFRVGFDFGAGYLTAGGVSGGAINFGLRLGWQFNDRWALLYQGNIPIGFVAGQTPGGESVGGIAIALTNALMGEFTLGNILHLGIGPSLDNAAAAVCTTSSGGSGSTTCIGPAGLFFGANARAALTFGGRRPGRRSGFSLGLDLHPTFTGQGVLFFSTVSLGAEWY